jgi:hypothetical protein
MTVMTTRFNLHVLETSCGVKAVGVFDDGDLTFAYQFVPPPPWKEEVTRAVFAEFDEWCDDVFAERVRPTAAKTSECRGFELTKG